MKIRLLLFFSFSALLISFGSCRKVTSAAAGLLASNDTAAVVFPDPLGSVSDFEEILTVEQIRVLDSIIVQYENKSDNKINIVTIKSIKPYDNLHDFSVNLLSSWENDDIEAKSVMLVFSEKLNEVQLTAGKDLKSKLSDKECKRIVKKTILTEIEKGDYFEGLKTGLQKIITELK